MGTPTNRCIKCGLDLAKSREKHPHITVDKAGKPHTTGFLCDHCYLKSLPDEVWEDLDKYHQGI